MSEPYEAAAATGERAVTCTHHCKVCGSHFSSLSAFDGHRTGRWEERHCIDPAEVTDSKERPRLVELTEKGVCRLARPMLDCPVAVWTERKSLEQARAHFGDAA